MKKVIQEQKTIRILDRDFRQLKPIPIHKMVRIMGVDFALHESSGFGFGSFPGEWTVSETKHGCRIASGENKREAVSNARQRISEAAKFFGSVDAALKTGYSKLRSAKAAARGAKKGERKA